MSQEMCTSLSLMCHEKMPSTTPPKVHNDVGLYIKRKEFLLKAKLRTGCEDPTLTSDPRVLENMLQLEKLYMPSNNYFENLQNDIRPWMRSKITKWMAEVCEEQNCEPEVFPLSVNYMDRVLSMKRIRRTDLQQLAAASMLVASKLKETLAMSLLHLIEYTDFSVTESQLSGCELFVLMTLEYKLSAVTHHDFINILVHHCDTVVSLPPGQWCNIKVEAKKFASVAVQNDDDLSFQIPSIVAVSALYLVLLDAWNKDTSDQLLAHWINLIQWSQERVYHSIEAMGQVVNKCYRKLLCLSSPAKAGREDEFPPRQNTPVNIQNIQPQ